MSCNGACSREKASCPFSLSTLPGDCCYISLCPVWTVGPVGLQCPGLGWVFRTLWTLQ